MNRHLRKQQGFTLIELGIVLAIMAVMLTLSIVSLSTIQDQSYASKSLEILLSDIKLQQARAMNGETNGETSTSRYGIHFETDTYTLFRGDTYTPSDPYNFTISLDGQLNFSAVLFTNSEIIFERGSGEIVGFTEGNDSFTFSDGTTVNMNSLGVFTQIQK